MRKFLLILSFVFVFFGCKTESNNSNYSDLFVLSDGFINYLAESSSRTYNLGATPVLTENQEYQVYPLGRIITIKIMHVATDEEYESLLAVFNKRYKNNSVVKKCYRNGGGTISIDCRT